MSQLCRGRGSGFSDLDFDSMDAGMWTCLACRELFRNPKTLPCVHSFCSECLRTVDDLWSLNDTREYGQGKQPTTHVQVGVVSTVDQERNRKRVEGTQSSSDPGNTWSQVDSELSGDCGSVLDRPEAVMSAQQETVDVNSSFPCPKCRARSTVPLEGVLDLQDHISALDHCCNMPSSGQERALVCNLCDGNGKVTFLCMGCEELYSSVCKDYHNRFSAVQDHVVKQFRLYPCSSPTPNSYVTVNEVACEGRSAPVSTPVSEHREFQSEPNHLSVPKRYTSSESQSPPNERLWTLLPAQTLPPFTIISSLKEQETGKNIAKCPRPTATNSIEKEPQSTNNRSMAEEPQSACDSPLLGSVQEAPRARSHSYFSTPALQFKCGRRCVHAFCVTSSGRFVTYSKIFKRKKKTRVTVFSASGDKQLNKRTETLNVTIAALEENLVLVADRDNSVISWTTTDSFQLQKLNDVTLTRPILSKPKPGAPVYVIGKTGKGVHDIDRVEFPGKFHHVFSVTQVPGNMIAFDVSLDEKYFAVLGTQALLTIKVYKKNQEFPVCTFEWGGDDGDICFFTPSLLGREVLLLTSSNCQRMLMLDHEDECQILSETALSRPSRLAKDSQGRVVVACDWEQPCLAEVLLFPN